MNNQSINAIEKPPTTLRLLRRLTQGLRGSPAWIPLALGTYNLGKIALTTWAILHTPTGIYDNLRQRGLGPDTIIMAQLTWLWLTLICLGVAFYLRRQHGTWNGPKEPEGTPPTGGIQA